MKPFNLLTGISATAGLLVLAGNALAQGIGTPPPTVPDPGGYTSRPLNPQSSPPAAVGNDLLLAEGVPGPSPEARTPAVPADSWTCDLQNDPNYTGSGDFNPSPKCTTPNVFNNSGPTGTYPATIGVGKHTENTISRWTTWYKPGSVLYYRYHYTLTYYDTKGMVQPAKFVDKPVLYYIMPPIQ